MSKARGAAETEFTFTASVYKVQTLVDNGLRVALDLPEGAIKQAAMLMECQRQGIVLEVIVRQATTI